MGFCKRKGAHQIEVKTWNQTEMYCFFVRLLTHRFPWTNYLNFMRIRWSDKTRTRTRLQNHRIDGFLPMHESAHQYVATAWIFIFDWWLPLQHRKLRAHSNLVQKPMASNEIEHIRLEKLDIGHQQFSWFSTCLQFKSFWFGVAWRLHCIVMGIEDDRYKMNELGNNWFGLFGWNEGEN